MGNPRRRKVVIAGQVPPPVGGQAVMIARLLAEMRDHPAIHTEHLSFRFTRDVQQARKAGVGKVFELCLVVWRLWRIRAAGAIDLLVFPIGGPQLVPCIRDLALLPFILLACRRVAIHFHAGGIAEFLPKLPRLLRVSLKALYARADAGIVMTNFGKRDPESLGIRNVLVIPHLLSDSYDPALLTRAEPVPTLLYVGHICPDKGTTALLAAVAAVQSQGHRCELSLVGECLAPYTEDDLTKDIERLGLGSSVKLAGVRSGEEKWRQFAAADLFVFPSVAPESFGLVLVEAMMWALPIVATDWRGSSEILGNPPGGVCFAPASDLNQHLTAALSEALGQRDRWDSWGRQNRERYERRFKRGADRSRLVSALAQLAGEN